jgi:hypothetical protein
MSQVLWNLANNSRHKKNFRLRCSGTVANRLGEILPWKIKMHLLILLKYFLHYLKTHVENEQKIETMLKGTFSY